MDGLEAMKKLATAARNEPVPGVNVQAAIMARIRRGRRAPERTLAIFAALSSVAAVAMAAVSVYLWVVTNDPLINIFSLAQW